MANNCQKKDKRSWKIRKHAVKIHLKLKVSEKTQWADHELYSIYFAEVAEPFGNSTLEFIQKALVDNIFNEFAH